MMKIHRAGDLPWKPAPLGSQETPDTGGSPPDMPLHLARRNHPSYATPGSGRPPGSGCTLAGHQHGAGDAKDLEAEYVPFPEGNTS